MEQYQQRLAEYEDSRPAEEVLDSKRKLICTGEVSITKGKTRQDETKKKLDEKGRHLAELEARRD